MVGFLSSYDERNLATDFNDHLFGGSADSRHGQSRESVGDHSTEEETSEGERLEDVDNEGRFVIIGNTGNVGTEESESDEAGRADSETLTDGSGGVTSSVKMISFVTDIFVEVAHLSDTASVIRNGTVAINSEANWEASEHTNGSKSDTVHSSPVEGKEDSDGKADNGDNVGLVTKSEALDNVGSGVEEASFGKLLGRAERVGGVVFSGHTDKETRPETEQDASEHFVAGSSVDFTSEGDVKLSGEHVDAGKEADGHKAGGDKELGTEFPFDAQTANVRELDADERGDDTN